MKIGVISDTHGLLRPEALAQITGADHIIHAGDIGNPDIVPRLARIARSPRSAATSIRSHGLRHSRQGMC